MHGVQPSAEQHAEQRRGAEPDGRHRVHPHVALEPRHHAGEDEAER